MRWGFAAKPFDVVAVQLSISGDGDAPRLVPTLSLRETSPLVYDWTTSEAQIYAAAPRTALPSAFNLPPPSAISVAEHIYQTFVGTGLKVLARVSWEASPSVFAAQYQVESRIGVAQWQLVGRTDQLFLDYLDIAPAIWEFRVKAINQIGVSSAYDSIVQEIFGLGAPPVGLNNVTLQSAGGMTVLKWDSHPDLDVQIGGRIVIRHSIAGSPTWANSVSMDVVAGSQAIAVVPQKAGTYLLRAEDAGGIAGPETAINATGYQAVTFSAVTTLTEDTAFTGAMAGVVASAGALQLDSSSPIDSWASFDAIVNFDQEGGILPTGTYSFATGMNLGAIKLISLRSVIDLSILDLTSTVDARLGDIDTWASFDGTGGGAGNSPPYFSSAGHITPPTGGIGAVFTLSAPVAGGYPTPTTTLTALTQAGVDVLASVVGSQYTSTAVGALVATWTATNGVYPDATGTASATISITPVAPVLLTAGSIAPSSGAVGTVFTLTKPTASGVPTPTVTLTGLTQNGVDVFGSVVANAFISTASGALVATWTISNSAGTLAPATATATVSAATGAPAITVVGAISPPSGAIGTVFTLTPPTATGTPSPTVSLTALTQNGTDVLGQVSGNSFTSTAAGPLVATWTASNGVNPAATSTANGSVLPVLALALTDFGTDRGIYPSAAHLSRNYGIIPATGTGTNGEVVQVRALSVDDGGATSTAWTDVATIAGGTWSGSVNVLRSASWYKLEARMKSQPAVSRQTANRFGVGHVVAIWGQSEPNFITQSSYSQTANFNVSDSESLQVFHFSGSMPSLTPTRKFISNATPGTSALTALAETLIAARPGEKFAFIFQTVAGTSFTSLVNDGDPARNWSDALALHNLATSEGRDVDVAASSWFSAPAGFGAAYADASLSLVAKKTTAGTAVTIPGSVPNAAGNFQADHWFGELYNYSNTRWLAYGPHRFDPQSDLSNSRTLLAGGAYTSGQNRQGCRTSWMALPQNANAAGYFLPALAYSPLTYLCGYALNGTTWTDLIHPGNNSVDGLPMFARHTALATLQGMGLTALTTPNFDNCYWEPSGAYVEVWSSVGPITTVRKARGLAALPATFAHWTEVAGFEINSILVTSALIQANGRVRITKPGGGSFVSSDVLAFGTGEGAGSMKTPEDSFNGFWMNYPIVVQAAAPTIDGVPVQPLPSAAALANTIVPVNPFFTTVSGQLTRFTDTASWPTTGGKMTLAVDMALTSLAAQSYIAEMSNLHVTLSAATNGQLFLAIKDSASTSILASTLIGTIAIGTRFSLIVAIDLAALTAWTTLNGVTTARTLGANTGILASASRKMGFLARASGTTGNCIAQVYQLELWTDCIAGGGKPPTDTLLRANGRITGTPATVNAHPWKAGGDVI